MGKIPFGLLPEGADVQAGSRRTLWLTAATCWDIPWLGWAGPGCAPTALGSWHPSKMLLSPANAGGRCTAGLGCSHVSIDGGESIPCSAFKAGLIINIKMPTDLQWEKKKMFVTLSTFTRNNSSEPGADFEHKEVPGWWGWRCTPWKGQADAETSVCSLFWQNRGAGKGSSRASPRKKRRDQIALCQPKERKYFYSWKCWKAPAVRRSRWMSALLLSLHILFKTSQISPVSGWSLQSSVISCLVWLFLAFLEAQEESQQSWTQFNAWIVLSCSGTRSRDRFHSFIVSALGKHKCFSCVRGYF